MSSLVVAGLGALLGAAIGVWRSYSTLMKRLEPEQRTHWNSLSLRERRRVRKAVRKGRPVPDPELARIATEVAATMRPSLGAGFVLIGLACFFGVLGLVALTEGRVGDVVLSGAVSAGLIGIVAWEFPRQRSRVARAEAANRALAASSSPRHT